MRDTTALVSVIVPVYNASATIRRCVDSILAQTGENLEILLVNDGSRDESLSILLEYEAKDKRIKVFSQPNGGVSSARNLALPHAQGVFVQFVDSDDSLLPGATKTLRRALETQRCELVIASYEELVGRSRQRRGFFKTDMVLSQSNMLDKLSIHPNSFYYGVVWNKLYRRDIIVDQGLAFHPGLPWGEDFAFNMQYMRHTQNTALLAQPVYEYSRNLNGLALSTGIRTVLHPLHSIRIKQMLHRHYCQLYIDTGLYQKYRHRLPLYMFKVTLTR